MLVGVLYVRVNAVSYSVEIKIVRMKLESAVTRVDHEHARRVAEEARSIQGVGIG